MMMLFGKAQKIVMKLLRLLLLSNILLCPIVLKAGIWQNTMQSGQVGSMGEYRMRTTSSIVAKSYASGGMQWQGNIKTSGNQAAQVGQQSVYLSSALAATNVYSSPLSSSSLNKSAMVRPARGFMQISTMPAMTQCSNIDAAIVSSAFATGRSVFYKPPTGDDVIYGNSLEEWASSAIAYSDGDVKYYNYALLKELYDAYCDAHDGQGPNGLSWTQLLAWLQANTSENVQNYRLPMGNGLAILLVLAAGYSLKKMV